MAGDFLEGYYQSQRRRQEETLNEIRAASSLMAIVEQVRQREQDNQLRQTVSGSGGDPAAAVQALLKAGTPRAIELAAKLREFLPRPKEPEPFTLTPGAVRYGPDGRVLASAPEKADSGFTLSPGAVRYGADGQVIASAPSVPREPTPPEVVNIQRFIDMLPAGDPRRKPLEDRLRILTTRQPPLQIHMPASSDTVQGTDGRWYKFRVGRDGRREAIPLETPGGDPLRPPESAADQRDRVAAQEGALTVESVRARAAEMARLIHQNTGVVGPAGLARRFGETAAGVVSPNVATPALDYQNNLRLLLADVRKVVEKDPNLSNQERANLYETLGGGIFQTPGSAMRTINNVLGYVESKRLGGPSRDRGPALPTPRTRAEFDALPSGARYIDPDDGKPYRKP